MPQVQTMLKPPIMHMVYAWPWLQLVAMLCFALALLVQLFAMPSAGLGWLTCRQVVVCTGVGSYGMHD